MTDIVERLRERAKNERAIQTNNLAVADGLKSQLEAFERRDGSHNTFALRLHLDHRQCAKTDGELAHDWDEAADTIAALMTERASLIATKREQLDALTAERDMWRAQALRGGS